jgi:hypothetical protein
MSKSRTIASNLGTTSGAGGGVTAYDSAGLLPTSGNTAGDLAFTTDKKALYNWDGSEWDRVYSGPNETLTWDTPLGATTGLVLDGSQQVIQVAAAADKEGFPISYNYELSPSAPQQLDSNFTIIDSDNGRFTIKPTTNTNRAGTFQFRATATDGTHVISTTTTATLAFRYIAEGVETISETITVNGSETWRYHLFDSSSSFTVTQDIDSAEYILIGGGGDGGTNGGGGGGAGGFLKGSTALTAGTYTYTIGAAGVYGTTGAGADTMASAWNGENSTLTGTGVSLTAYGGGGGGLRTGTTPYIEARGQAGGSSGGNGGGNNTSSNPYAPLASGAQGNAGGDDGSTDTNAAGGGGGGAGSAGTAGAYRQGGNGGAGIQDNFTGTLTYYSAGGAGNVVVNGSAGSPGLGHDSASYGMGGAGDTIAGHGPATQGVLMIRYRLA